MFRRMVRGAAGLGLALVSALAGGFLWVSRPLDRRPILGSVLEQTAERAIALGEKRLTEKPASGGALLAGWGRADITPALGTPTFGYGGRFARGATRIADRLHARALAFQAGVGAPVVFLSADLCLWPRGLADEVARRLAPLLARDRIYFGATHTHNGPGPIMRAPALVPLFGRYDPECAERIVAGAVEAVRTALAGLVPARLRTLRRALPEFVHNRALADEPLDDELVVLEVRGANGERAALVSYPAHATTISMEGEVVISGDYPGALCRALERRGFSSALFLAGSTGQAGPWLEGQTNTRSTALAERIGERLADAVVALVETSTTPFEHALTIDTLRVPIALPPWRFRVAGRMVAPPVARRLLGASPRAHVHALRLGKSVWIGHSFEFSAMLARTLKHRARERGYALVITSFNGAHHFYVVPDAHYDDAHYESGMTCFGPGLGSYLAKLTDRISELLHEH